MTEYEIVEKEETKIETKTKSNKQDKNEVHASINKEGVRERKKQPIQNNSENRINQPLPTITYFDIAIDKFTKIRNKIVKYYNEYPLRTISIGLIVTIFFIFTFTYSGSSDGESSPFFQKFAGTTKIVFEEINSVELPASNAIMQHTVACRNVANMIQRSPAFGNHGRQIASGLRDFGEKVMVAGRDLQKMYNKGSSAYRSFDIEIKAMTERLNSVRRLGDAKFFKDRISKLINNIREFRKAVDKTQSSIIDADVVRDDTEGYIIDGLREAEKFVKNDKQHSVDLAKADKELKSVGDILDHLHNTAGHLDKMKKILMDYEDRLMDVEAALDNSGDVDDIFEVTNQDLSYLKLAVDNSKACLHKFTKLSA